MHFVTSGKHRAIASFGAIRSTLILAGIAGLMGLSLLALQLAAAPSAQAASFLHYQRGYYLDNGWLCYGWSNGTYRCTHHWTRAANGTLVSLNTRWVPNGLGNGATYSSPRATTRTVRPAAPRHVTNAPAARVAQPAPTQGGVAGEIMAVFGPYGSQALAVARCESGLNPNAINRSSGASGVFQFLASTWRTTSYAGSSPFNASANIHAAYQVFTRDGHSWREWTCQP